MLLVGSGKYPCGGPHTIITLRWACIWGKVPPDPASSVYNGCVSCGCAAKSFRSNGRTTRPYDIIESGSP